MKKIGLFFGSFNPIHVGHLVIANYMVEFTDLDKVWFVVSPHNPFKEKHTLLADIQRLQMVRIAVEDDNRFKASNIEFQLPQPSYTVNTLAYLGEKYPQYQFALIMGSDNLQSLHKWKNYETILERHHIYVYPRPGKDGGELKDHPQVTLTEAPYMEISSSFIRKAIKAKKDVRYMMPEAVAEYVREMHFYEK